MPPKKINGLRKRLTLGECDPVTQGLSGGGGNSSEANRGVLMALRGTDVLDNLHADEKEKGGRRMSLSSATDANKQRRQSFSAKDEVCEGGKKEEVHNSMTQMGIGIVCKKGLKPESPNQDSFAVTILEDKFKLYGVFDGHGPTGHDVSNFVRENTVKLFLRSPQRDEDPQAAMSDAFVQSQKLLEHLGAQREMDCSMSGATATMVYQNLKTAQLVVAHCGDSRAVLGCRKGKSYEAVELTVDHKPNLPEEKARIEKAGGRVVFDGYFNHRVFTKDGRGGLNMSRALGDSVAHKAGVSAEPETKIVDTSKIGADEIFLLVCSDGVWEFIENQEAVNIVSKFGREQAQQAVEELSKTAWDRWIDDSGGEVSDDITAMIAYL